MAGQRVALGSRTRFARFFTLQGVEYWDRITPFEVPEQPGDSYRIVQSYDRLDLLAYEIYGDDNLQWVIALANGIEIWPTGLNPGDTIRIPSPQYVRERLFDTAVR
jgi:hypothetical protein